MIEIQQLIVRAKINDGDFDEQNILHIIEETIDKRIKDNSLLQTSDKQEIIEECTRLVFKQIKRNVEP